MNRVKGIAFVSVYADSFEKAFRFYTEILGLEKEYDMGSQAAFLKLGEDSGIYLQGGSRKMQRDEQSCRASFTLSVESAGEIFDLLKKENLRIVQDVPMDMGQGDFWFQFFDPSGNMIEILGGK